MVQLHRCARPPRVTGVAVFAARTSSVMASVSGSTPDFHRATTTYLFTAFKGSAQADAGPQLWIQAIEEVDYDESDDKAARAAAPVARKHATRGKGYSVESICFGGGSAFERQAAFPDLLIQAHDNAKTVRAHEPVRILHARR
jgi:hypothetical protein